jgi:uncharacterized protein (UPF0276 family)
MTTITARIPASVRALAPALPWRAGIGLEPGQWQALLDGQPDIGFVGLRAEHCTADDEPLHRVLALARERYPLSLRCGALSIGGDGPLDEAHLDRLALLVERCEPASIAVPLAFADDRCAPRHDRASLQRVCRHVDRVQERLHGRVLVENPCRGAEFEASDLSEAGLLREVLDRTGCGLALDIDNALASGTRDALSFLRELPLHAVGEVRLRGDDAAWPVYADAIARLGPVPTLIAGGADRAALAALLAHAHRADGAMTVRAVPKRCGIYWGGA